MKGKVSSIGILLLAALLACCGGGQKQGGADTLVVRVDTVRAEGQGSLLQFPGKVASASEVNASFKVAGTLKKVYVREGERVRAGQLIAELDPTDYQVQLAATEAEYAHIKADAERVMGLYQDGGTTASQYDKARYGLQQIEAKLQHHRNQLAYTRIMAPVGGAVQRCFFEGGETVGAGMPIVSIVSDGALEVVVNLPASSYMRRADFSAYSCTLDVLPDRELPLSLVSILPKANANQLYTMRLRMAQGEGQVAPGMSAWVSIQLADTLSRAAMRVPSTALAHDGGAAYAFLYNPKSGAVRRVAVRVETLHTDGTATVTGSLKEGDQIVSTGVHHLKDGDRVNLLEPQTATNIGGLL